MNAAPRILDIVRNFSQQPGNQQALRSWGNAFGLREGPHLEDEVAACVGALRQELVLIQRVLRMKGLVPEAYTWLEHLREAASSTKLTHPTQALQSQVASEQSLITLNWAVWALGEDKEIAADEAELERVLSDLAQLEESLPTAPLTPFGQAFVRQQIESMRLALRLYRVQGSKALREVLSKMRAEAAESYQDLDEEYASAPPEGKTTLRKVFETAAAIGTMYEVVTQVKGGVESAYALGQQWLVPLLEHMPK